MRIEILRWRSEGLRCPDVAIDLTTSGQPAHVVLLQMPNGTGKTTTLTMLRAAMCGKQLDRQQILDLRRPGNENETGRFELELRIDGDPLAIEARLHFDEGALQYYLTSPKLGGIVTGWQPPPNVRRFLNERFVNLFVFDGEFADHLLDPHKTKAADAIDALFQLYLLEDVAKRAHDDWEETSRSKSSKSDQGLTRHRNNLKKLETRIRTVKKARAEQEARISDIDAEIADIEAILDQQLNSESTLAKHLDAAKDARAIAVSKVELGAVEVMGEIRRPYLLHPAFSIALAEMRDNLDRLKLPASSSRQFFDELINEPLCICGRPLDDDSRAHLAHRAEAVMGEDTSGILNSMKADIQAALETSRAAPTMLAEQVTAMVDVIVERDDAGSKVRALEEAYARSGGQETADLQASLQRLRDERTEVEEILDEINRKPIAQDRAKDVDQLFCLTQLQAKRDEEERLIADISGTVKLRDQTELLRGILEGALGIARKRIRETLREECNARLETVLGRDPILIERITNHLTLRNQSGASVGQTLSIGYTFLATLLNRGQHKFPLVVDSPANPLSKEIRREVAKLVPELCDQFVAFTTSAEREGFTTTIERSFPNDVKFLTLFRRTPGTRHLEASLPNDGVVMSTSGVLVEGPAYFNSFDNVEEEA